MRRSLFLDISPFFNEKSTAISDDAFMGDIFNEIYLRFYLNYDYRTLLL